MHQDMHLKILDLMKEAHSEVFDFLTDHPTLSAVMNRMSKMFPALPKPKQSIVSLERDDPGEDPTNEDSP